MGGTRRYWCALAAVVLAAAVIPSIAQDARPGQPPAQPSSALAGKIELSRLVDLASQRLRLTVHYDEGALKQVVTLRIQDDLTDQQLWALTNQVLAAHGFTTVRRAEGTMAVVKVSDAAAIAPIGGEAGNAGYVTAVRPVRNRPAKEIADALQKVTGKTGVSIAALDDPVGPGLLVISDLSDRVEQLQALIDTLDRAAPRAAVEEVPAVNMPAAQLVTAVAQVAAKGDAVSGRKAQGEVVVSPDGTSVLVVALPDDLEYWKQLVVRLDQREKVERLTYSPHAFGAAEVAKLIEATAKDLSPGDDRWRVVVDDLTGTLIVTATPAQHEAIRALVERLDATPPAEHRPVRSFTVKNRSVGELLPVLDSLISAGVLESPPGGRSNGPADISAPRLPPDTRLAPGSPQLPTDPSSAPPRSSSVQGPGTIAPTLTADEATNTIIAMGDGRFLDQLGRLIEQLDVRQPQVMLDVLLVSLNDAQTIELGVELEKLVNLGGDTTARIASLFGLATRANGVPTVTGSGFSGVVLNPGEFSAVVRALQTLQRGKSLSMPRLLVGNNQQASLDSILEQPFANTNASNTVTTTSFGGTLPAGTQVTIKPQIAEGDHLTLEYQVSLSSFTGAAADPSLPPPRQQNKVQSVATIPDGHTVVVGGIDLNTDGRRVSQVPILGDIPFIGAAFKRRSDTDSHTRFFVFIRANVMRARGFEDLKYASDLSTAAAGVDDGFPELEPRVIR